MSNQPTQPNTPRVRWLRELLWWGTFCLVAFAMRSSIASTYRVPSESMEPTMIPPGHFFVMGDNRDYSGDSRIFGSISKDQLQAKALRHFYSVERDFPYIRWGRLFAPLQ